MKKIIISVFALLAMFMTSCSNEDITIEAPTTVNINAAGVIAPFTWEYEPGELEAFGSSYRLRIRALVYNDKGELVKQATEMFSNYNVQLKSSVFLSSGTYTVIGISDVVGVNGSSVSTEYWKINGEAKLSEMQIIDGGTIGNFAKILGVAKNTVTVQGSKTNSVDVNLKPVGALIYSFFFDMDQIVPYNVTHLKLLANKACEAISFDGSGDYRIIEKNETNTSYRVSRVDASLGFAYRYNFLLPMKNLNLWFACEQDGETKTFGTDEGALVDVVAGDEYICEIDLNSDISQIATYYSYANKTKTRTRAQIWAEKWNKRVPIHSNYEANIIKEKPYNDCDVFGGAK